MNLLTAPDAKIRFVKYYNAGAALANDDAPNTTAPAEARVISMPNAGYAVTLAAYAVGGTSGTVLSWIYSPELAYWVRGPTVIQTLTSATTATAQYVVGGMAKRIFVQLVANTGLTELYYGIL